MGYVNPKSVIAVGTVLPSLATIAVALRFYARRRLNVAIGVDDFLVVFALVLTVGLGMILVIGSALESLGQPTPAGNGPTGYFFATNNALILAEKLEWSFNLIQILALGTVKLSLIFLYKRIFLGKTFELLTTVMIAIVTCWTIAFFLATLFLCRTDFWAIWGSLDDLLTHCVDSSKVTIYFSASDVVTDIMILAIPLRPIWQLQMGGRQKLAVSLAFLVGAITVAAGATRLGIYSAQTIGAYKSSDGIGILTTQQFWSMIEIGSSIVGACAPTLRTLYKDLSLITTIRTLGRRSFTALALPTGGMSPMTEKPEQEFTPTRRGAYLRFSQARETWLETEHARESDSEEDVEYGLAVREPRAL